MVAGLKFLSKKSFNPQNLNNQKSVWEREQEHKREEARVRERERQLTIERDHEELARSREGASGGQKATLRFMYDAPPGLQQSQSSIHGHDVKDGDVGDCLNNRHAASGAKGTDDSHKSSRDRDHDDDGNHPQESFSFQRNSGDDDAAAAFRRMLAGAVSSKHDSSNRHKDESILLPQQNQNMVTSSLIISGSTAEAGTMDKSQLTQLEKAVGKKNGSSTLTYQEQIARFPQLKNAPVALKQKGRKSSDTTTGEESIQTHLNFKPLGAQIRNVRCMACKIWGHSKGDRECKLSGWDPFSLTTTSASNRLDGIESSSDSNVDRQSHSSNVNVNQEERIKYMDKRKKRNEIDDDNSDDYSIEKRYKHKKKKKRKHGKEKSSQRTRRDEIKSKKKKSHSRDKCSSYEYSDDESSNESESRRGRHERKRKRHHSHRRHRECSPCSRSPSSNSW
jgi:N-terminal domain of CBF1 interacting co-repressor CIR.